MIHKWHQLLVLELFSMPFDTWCSKEHYQVSMIPLFQKMARATEKPSRIVGMDISKEQEEIKKNKEELIKMLQEYNYTQEIKTSQQEKLTPLIAASYFNLPDIIEFLVKQKNQNVNEQDLDATPLIAAIRTTNLEAVKKLLELGANPHQIINNVSPFIESFKQLILSLSSYDPKTPQKAAEVTKLLLSKRINENDIKYMNDYARKRKKPLLIETVENIKNKEGYIYLLEILLLLKENPDQDDQNTTPLALAIELEIPDAVALLLQARANPNKIISGKTRAPLWQAVQQRSEAYNKEKKEKLNAIINLLLDTGKLNNISKSRLNEPLANNETFLTKAISDQDTDFIHLLIKAGADVNSQDKTGKTPLIKAIEEKNLDIIFMLLQARANPQQEDAFTTPLKAAQETGNKEIISMITKAIGIEIPTPTFEEINKLLLDTEVSLMALSQRIQ